MRRERGFGQLTQCPRILIADGGNDFGKHQRRIANVLDTKSQPGLPAGTTRTHQENLTSAPSCDEWKDVGLCNAKPTSRADNTEDGQDARGGEIDGVLTVG